MNVLDTNVWIYSHDRRDPRKQALAQELIRSSSPKALPWQVGCEFIAAARKLEPFGFSLIAAWEALDDMQRMADVILLPVPAIWLETRDLQGRHQLSFWDSLIVATCLRESVSRLYSEDFGDRREIDGLEIINPFRTT